MTDSKRLVVEHLSKKFSKTTRDSLKYGLSDSLKKITRQTLENRLRNGEFWALDDVSFELNEGDSLGMMGVNGSGKTTLLRILNSTFTPTAGRAVIYGQVGSLIAAGAGFAPLLSGRENIFINGTLLGLNPKEIRSKLDEIVAFSGLEEYIDMPVKNYSSGMSVKLGFAIATIGTPDILLVDEVLAVGDVNFQKKCYEKINDLKQQGTTIILVSHSIGAIWSACNKGLVLHNGRTNGIESVEEACRRYEDNNSKVVSNKLKETEQNSTLFDVRVDLNSMDNLCSEFEYGSELEFEIQIDSNSSIAEGIVRIQIDSEVHKGLVIIDSYESSNDFLPISIGRNRVSVKLLGQKFRPGRYYVSFSIIDRKIGLHLFNQQNVATFVVVNNRENFFYADPRAAIHIDSIFDFESEN